MKKKYEVEKKKILSQENNTKLNNAKLEKNNTKLKKNNTKVRSNNHWLRNDTDI